MATIDEVSKLYQQIDMMQTAKDLVKSNEASILDVNRNQLRAGNDSDGKYIRPEYYKEEYAIYKTRYMGSMAPFRTPDLLLTGKFYRSFKFDGDFRVISTGVPYASELESKYGANIYGFDDRNLTAVRAMYMEEIRKKVGL
jgi:hypothetical protein